MGDRAADGDRPAGSVGEDGLAALWPGTPPRDQIAIWTGISATDRAKVARRLEAVVAYEAGGRRDAPGHAAIAGIGEPRFYKMMQAWRRERSLLSLVPQVRGRAARAFAVPPGIEQAAADAVKANPQSSQEAIAVFLYDRFGAPSLSWIRRLVARKRRNLARDLAGGFEGFGRRLIIDSAALPLPLLSEGRDAVDGGAPEEEEEIEWAVAAFFWDEDTKLICGHALERAPASIRLHLAAAAAASRTLRSLNGPAFADRSTEIATTMPLPERNYLDAMRLSNKLDAVGVKTIEGPRAVGGELATAFNSRLGSLDFRPRFANDSFKIGVPRAEALKRSGRVPMTLTEARLVLDFEVETYNAEVRRGLATPVGALTSVADRLDGMIAEIVPG